MTIYTVLAVESLVIHKFNLSHMILIFFVPIVDFYLNIKKGLNTNVCIILYYIILTYYKCQA